MMKSFTGSVKAVLKDPRDRCAGKLQLFYAGALQSVCTSIDEETQNVICANLSCGKALSFNPMFSSTGLSSFTCQSGNISNCSFSSTEVQQCSVGHLKCTGIAFYVFSIV